jgi:hypothetical protein
MDPGPDADPDPAIFIVHLQDANKNLNFCFLLFEGTGTHYIIIQR